MDKSTWSSNVILICDANGDRRIGELVIAIINRKKRDGNAEGEWSKIVVISSSSSDSIISTGVICKAGLKRVDVVAAISNEGWRCIMSSNRFDISMSTCIRIKKRIRSDELVSNSTKRKA